MKHQIDWTQITCGRGDEGETDLLYGATCSKADERILTVGHIDRLCVLIGSIGVYNNIKQRCNEVQLDLRDIMSWIVCPENKKHKFLKTKRHIKPIHIQRLEGHIKYFGMHLNQIEFMPSETGWVMYGEGNLKSLGVFEVCCDVRLIESYVVSEYEKSIVRFFKEFHAPSDNLFEEFQNQWKLIIKYLNRLSKLLYLGSLYLYSLDADVDTQVSN